MFFFSNQKENVLAIPVAGAESASPHLNASSQHLYLSLLQMVSVFKLDTCDLKVVSDVVQDVVPQLHSLPSKELEPKIRCTGAANHGPWDHRIHS